MSDKSHRVEKMLLRCTLKDIRDGRHNDKEVIQKIEDLYLLIFERYKSSIIEDFNKHRYDGDYINNLSSEDVLEIVRNKE